MSSGTPNDFSIVTLEIQARAPYAGVMGRMRERLGRVVCLSGCLAGLLGCEEEKAAPISPPVPKLEAPPPAPPPKSPPRLSVDEGGPQVRGLGVVLTQPNGAPDALGLEKLQSYLADEKEFIEGKDLVVEVVRKAKPGYVATFLTELGKLSPTKISIATETRTEFPGQIEFVPQERLSNPDPCTLIGTITDDRGTAIWRLSGGTARKRGRGMGGPDLSMTAETIESMTEKCESKLFFVTGADGIEWGLVYDLAAAGLSLEKAGLKQAVVPTKRATAGSAYEL